MQAHQEDLWNTVPYHVLVNILLRLGWQNRLQARAVCKAWMLAWKAPVLWRDIRVVINKKKDAYASTVLRQFLQYAKNVELFWASAPRKDRLRLRACDLENRQFVADAVASVKASCILRTLKLYLDNPCSVDVEFIHHVQGQLREILARNPKLEYVSLGCHQLVMPDCILDHLADSCHVKQLHLASVPPRYRQSQPPSTSLLAGDRLHHVVVQMTRLTHLSLDWKHVTNELLEAINNRSSPVPLKSLQVFLSGHTANVCSITHPSADQWQVFARDNPEALLFMVFVYNVEGLCSALQHPCLPVVLKMVENQQIQLDSFQQVISWHQSRIVGLVFVNTVSSPVYDPASVMPLASLIKPCHRLRYLAIIGRYIPSEAVLWMVQNFSLQQLVVSQTHILTGAEASNFLVPISASKYTDFKREISRLLGRQWQALTSVPFKHANAYYFSDGLDNELYLNGAAFS